MNPILQLLLADALKIVLPLAAERIAEFAVDKEPEIKAILDGKFGAGSPIIEEVYQLLIEPGLVTIGALFSALGGAAPVHAGAQPAARAPVIPTYNDD